MDTTDEIETIDISNPKCWNNITKRYKNKILVIFKIMRPLFQSYMTFANLGINSYKLFKGVIMYENEILEISKILDITFNECLLFQLTYEMFSACTSCILKCDDNYVHVRTMDWELKELKDITIKIRVFRKEIHLFDCITWAGFVGVFTGIKPNKYTIALNYRRSLNSNIKNNLLYFFKGAYPNAFFMRHLLESNELPDKIMNVLLVAPAYYTVLYTPELKQSGVIIRDRDGYKLKSIPCIQTNCDEIYKGDNIMHSFERIKHMETIIEFNPTIDDLIQHISEYPVTNEHTIYTTIMSPEKGFFYYKL